MAALFERSVLGLDVGSHGLKAVELKVCYATAQSGGSNAGDYSELDGGFSQLDFEPKRTVTGAEQRLVLTGGVSGNRIVWTQATNCSFAAGGASSTKTAEYTISGQNFTA